MGRTPRRGAASGAVDEAGGEQRVRLRHSHMDEVDQITAKIYFPTTVEHKFMLAFCGIKRAIYGVGHAQRERLAWEYFNDVNAIIFLAQISAFD
ncbi:hypothetical protein V8D89_012831 [Ganoderma adspersum]